ncbi:MAG: DUF262 domain-containing protein [Bacteroidales bacterium]|nr:DUF262 domain-containing protein [Bacteroidales bacterium]
MPSARLSLRQIIDHAGGEFRIPDYQRRYIWGQQKRGSKNSATKLLANISKAFEAGEELFLQGITLSRRTDGGFDVVDGQQRLTFLYLLLLHLDPAKQYFKIKYDCRPSAEAWLAARDEKIDDPSSQDVYYFRLSLKAITQAAPKYSVDDLLDKIIFLYIELPEPDMSIGAYQMLNATKSVMNPCDVIKADLMRMASDPKQPYATDWDLNALRSRYASEWESWLRWWNAPAVRTYFGTTAKDPLDLLLRLGLRSRGSDCTTPLTYDEFRVAIEAEAPEPYHAAKHFFSKLRRTQKRFEEAYADTVAYNRIKAILLLQEPQAQFDFLHLYFITMEINDEALERYYKLSFLGMSIEEILSGQPESAKFDDMLATLSMADVYHSEAKKEAFNLLLRLNIDEDIKLGRRFDFRIWNNRSLEHIYSKSKVWHRNPDGRIFDGNDNELHISRHKLDSDPSFLHRDDIVNLDGVQLSEHCIGNLVLLYGQNNARFGNAGFEEKKMMFLAPGDMGVFESRNLLHSVCVFAGNTWTAQSIVDNYNLTLKNLKLYYGIK